MTSCCSFFEDPVIGMSDEKSNSFVIKVIELLSWPRVAMAGCTLMAALAGHRIFIAGDAAFPAAWAGAWAPTLLLISTAVGCGFMLSGWAVATVETKGREMMALMAGTIRALEDAQAQCLRREADHLERIRNIERDNERSNERVARLVLALRKSGIDTELGDL